CLSRSSIMMDYPIDVMEGNMPSPVARTVMDHDDDISLLGDSPNSFKYMDCSFMLKMQGIEDEGGAKRPMESPIETP
ncbi:hypothetical protein Ancab_014747, partial [Ancistrocladus abbreviatus]